MPDSISRSVLNALLPKGGIWTPAPDMDLDLLLDGVAANSEETRIFLSALATLRDPNRTALLSDLEEEYGIRTSSQKLEADRRAGLAALMSDTTSDGSLDTLQEKLTIAGFDVRVHTNSPAVDPDLFLTDQSNTWFGDAESMHGRAESMFGIGRVGEVLVNGGIFGDHIFTVPADPGYWPLIFFVGGVETRDEDTGELYHIAPAPIPNNRRDEIKRLILRYKPLHSWCGLIVSYV